jgi:predicted ester cyclase
MTDFAACADGIIQAYNDKDFDRLRAAVAPNLTMAHFNRGASFDNADDLIGLMQAFSDTLMPDRKFEPAEGVHVVGNVVVREGYWGGTAQQDLPGFAANGEVLRLRLCSVMTFDDNGILVDWKDHG